MPRLLIVEDDPAIVRAVEKTLTLAPGFELSWVREASEALGAVLKGKPDLVLLDVRLPGGDGRRVLASLKEHPAASRIPVIMLTGMGGEGDKVHGLNLGADDYVVKPFGAHELLARIQAVLRRAGGAAGGPPRAVKAGPLSIDPRARKAAVAGRELELQPREFDLLYLLASRPGETLSRDFLIESTSAYGSAVRTRSLDTHVKNIRRKLGSKAGMIRTVPKVGYRLDP